MAKDLAFRCECGKKMRVPINFAGQRGMCPSCEGKFTIPTPEAIEAVLPERLVVVPDELPELQPMDQSAPRDDKTALIERPVGAPSGDSEDDELEAFDPNEALAFFNQHGGDAGGSSEGPADEPTDIAAAGGADDGPGLAPAAEPTTGGDEGADPFRMDFFAEPTGELGAIEDVEADDLEQLTVGPTPVPPEVLALGDPTAPSSGDDGLVEAELVDETEHGEPPLSAELADDPEGDDEEPLSAELLDEALDAGSEPLSAELVDDTPDDGALDAELVEETLEEAVAEAALVEAETFEGLAVDDALVLADAEAEEAEEATEATEATEAGAAIGGAVPVPVPAPIAAPVPLEPAEPGEPVEPVEPAEVAEPVEPAEVAEPVEAESIEDFTGGFSGGFDDAFDGELTEGLGIAQTAEVALASADDDDAASADGEASGEEAGAPVAEPVDDLLDDDDELDAGDDGPGPIGPDSEVITAETTADEGSPMGGPGRFDTQENITADPSADDAGGPAGDGAGPLELDPDALADQGGADPGEGAGLGEDEGAQWDDELGGAGSADDAQPPALGLSTDIGSYRDDATAGDEDMGDAGEMAMPDLDIPSASGDEEGEEGDDDDNDVALTQVLDLDDILEAAEEVEPPPVGLATMEVHQLLAHCKQLLNKGEHVKPSEELLARLTSVDASPDVLLIRGHLRMRGGDQAAALEDYLLAKEQGKQDEDSLAAIDRHELDVLLDQVNQFIDEEPERAANLLRGIVAERPGYAKAYYFLGLALLATGDKEAALVELREASRLGHDVPELDDLEYEVELNTLELLREKDPRRLLVKLPPFLARWSSSARGYELLALALRSAGNRQSALEAYRKARTLGQTSAETDRIIYDLLIDLGRDEDAQEELERQLQGGTIDPFWVRVKFDQHFAEKNRRESVGALCQLTLHADGNRELMHNIGLLFSMFEPQETITELRKARSLNPENALLARMLADILVRVGAYNEALDLYGKLLEEAPGDAGILMSRALCWQMQMPPHPEKALADLRDAFP